MMKINRRIDYAIRVMLALAKESSGVRLPASHIQKSMLIPKAFLLRIVADLSKANLINTYPGPKGGIQLSRIASEINMRHVWEAVEGPILISDCIEYPEECPLSEGCPVNSRWAELQTIFINQLEATTMEGLAVEASRLNNSF